MRQIKFQPDLIGKPGIEVRYRNGEVPDWWKPYGTRVTSVDKIGQCFTHNPNGMLSYGLEDEYDLVMYRQQKSAEEIAKEVCDVFKPESKIVYEWRSYKWRSWGKDIKELMTGLVQSGMDEMNGGEE